MSNLQQSNWVCRGPGILLILIVLLLLISNPALSDQDLVVEIDPGEIQSSWSKIMINNRSWNASWVFE